MAKVVAGVQVMPDGKNKDTDGCVTEIVKIVQESGLNYEVGSKLTVIEGEFEEVMDVIIQMQREAINQPTDEVITNVKLYYNENDEGSEAQDNTPH
ncbi:MAG: thiamine-binding protein [Bacillus sp. (in: Bacteria)]|nr:thiamine-binding protein [Bacillus sp. (in: firmicutes)]